MQIDWLTVVAQIVNFLILVWLLKRFLYKPVVDAMDRREERIAERLRGAAERELRAADTMQDYRRKLEELEADRENMIERAKQAAESARVEMLEQARREAAERRALWQRQVEEERGDFLRGLRQQAADSIQTVARRALSDLAGTALEERIIDSFIERLQSLDENTRHAIAESEDAVVITTAFELDGPLRSRLTRVVHEHLRDGIEVDYEVSPELVCGIELTASGRRLAWTLDGYLDALEQRLQQLLERHSTADA